jgi:hypothetical protein
VQLGTNGEQATGEVATAVAAPATAADDSDEELHPADKKVLSLAGAIISLATESSDLTKNNDRLVAAMTAALEEADTAKDLKVLVDQLPSSGEFKLICFYISCVHVRPLNPFPTHNPPTPLILYRCTHLMNRLIKHLKELGSLPEETGNYE